MELCSIYLLFSHGVEERLIINWNVVIFVTLGKYVEIVYGHLRGQNVEQVFCPSNHFYIFNWPLYKCRYIFIQYRIQRKRA